MRQVIGLLVIMAAIWAGAYADAFFTEWMKFPAVASAVIIGGCGFVHAVEMLTTDLNNRKGEE